MREIMIKAPAKINWSLDITGKRADGYHLVKMLMQNISLCDELSLLEAEKDGIDCDMPLPLDESNIALRAWFLLKRELGLRKHLHIKIKKNIPVAAGLAGGSADAAAVLKGANRLFELGLNQKQLMALGLKLGADLPFCIQGGCALVQGIGESVKQLPPWPKQYLVVANPGFAVSTAAVYKEFSFDKIDKHPDTEALNAALRKGDVDEIGGLLVNLLESVTLKRYPKAAQLKEEMASLGLFPLMSGSGPSVFGLAREETHAFEAASALNHWPMAVVVHTFDGKLN